MNMEVAKSSRSQLADSKIKALRERFYKTQETSTTKFSAIGDVLDQVTQQILLQREASE